MRMRSVAASSTAAFVKDSRVPSPSGYQIVSYPSVSISRAAGRASAAGMTVKPPIQTPILPSRTAERYSRLQLEAMPDDVHAELVALLRAEGVEFRLTHHEPVTTSAEAAAVRGAELRSGAKAMLVKGKAGLVLAVLAADRKVDWKLLAPLVGGKGARFANDEELGAATGLSKGAVPPFGRLFGLRTIYDESLLDVETVNFNAGSHTDSIAMRRADLIRVGGGEIAAFSTP
jgi:Ala-tRNA(Pro) deacylase